MTDRLSMLLCGAMGIVVASHPACARADEVDDARVRQAIKKGVDFLLRTQAGDGSWGTYGKPGESNYHRTGPTALVTYALLESGLSAQDPRIRKALAFVGPHDETGTYSLGLRCLMWHATDRTAKGTYRRVLGGEAQRLWRSTATGNYDYQSKGRARAGRWDNSNSQYGVLGVWAAELAGLEVPAAYWRLVARHWENTQNADGGWGYTRGNASTAAMTAGGVASLFVAYDVILREQFANCNVASKYTLRLERGLGRIDSQFDRNLKGENLGHADRYYWLYAVERVGLASGKRYFGEHNWYRGGTEFLLKEQDGDGGWKGKWMDKTIATAYALLFLARGRNPVLINKLEFDGDWNNRPRDLANLTKWMGRQFERTLNWQIVSVRAPLAEWDDASILYLSASRAPKIADEDVRKLRTFCLRGGTLLSASECGGVAGYKKGIRHLCKRIFPQYEMAPCPPTHEIYTKQVQFDLIGRQSGSRVRILPDGSRITIPAAGRGPKPTFCMVHNGVRPLVIHTDADAPLSWQLARTVTHRWAYQAAVNAVLYATDTVSNARPRGTRAWPEPCRGGASRSATLVRLKHAGNYDPEPLAYERFVRLMGHRAKTKLTVEGPIAIADLPRAKARVAALTGTGPLTLTDEEQKILKGFVDGGGLLVIDSAGGGAEFALAAGKLVRRMFGPRSLRPLATTAPLYRLSGMTIDKVRYRRRTRARLGKPRNPLLMAVLIGSRAGVLVSREDITAGLVGYESMPVDGYAPESAFEIMRNIVLSAH